MREEIKQRIEQIRRGEVPEGYKKTKVGIVPKEWENKKLGELFAERNDVNCSDEQLLSITADRGVIPRAQIQGKDNSSENKSKYKHISKGDIGYNTMRMWQGVSALSVYDGIVSPAYTVLKPSAQVNALCFSYFFKLTNMINVFYRHSQGLVDDTRSLKYEWFKSIAVSVPSLAEQEKIAVILQTQDKLIELQQKKIEELNRLKKAYLSKLFPKKGCNVPEIRFPGFTDPWEQRKLGEVCNSFEYGLNAAAKEFDGINKYIRITDIDDDSRVFIDSDLTSPDCDLCSAEKYKLQDGDIVFARTGASVGKTFIYKASDGLVYYAGFLIRAKINENTYPDFVFYNTLTKKYERFIRITSQRSGQPGVNAQEYSSFEFSLPSYEEQKKIGEYFRHLDNLITLHQRKLDEERKKKKALMQLLLTGIVRVK